MNDMSMKWGCCFWVGVSGMVRSERGTGEKYVCSNFIYLNGNRKMKPVKIIFKGERGVKKSNKGSEFDQSTLCVCVCGNITVKPFCAINMY
jgi:hypothetical protein